MNHLPRYPGYVQKSRSRGRLSLTRKIRGQKALKNVTTAFFCCNSVNIVKIIVRPRLEYCIQAWRPYLRKDINVLGRVQKRATKLISGLSGLGCEERLKILRLKHKG